jgi:hypothetical protein
LPRGKRCSSGVERRTVAAVGCSVTLRWEDTAAVVGEHDEDEEEAQAGRGHGEEIDRDQVPGMVGEERPPGLRGLGAPLRHQPGHGALGHVEAELQDLAIDARGAPDFLWFMSSDLFLRMP